MNTDKGERFNTEKTEKSLEHREGKYQRRGAKSAEKTGREILRPALGKGAVLKVTTLLVSAKTRRAQRKAGEDLFRADWDGLYGLRIALAGFGCGLLSD
jgi:hypothetical protein